MYKPAYELIDTRAHCLTRKQEEELLTYKPGSILSNYVKNVEEVSAIEDEGLSRTERALISQLKSAGHGSITKVVLLALESDKINYPFERVMKLARRYKDCLIGSVSVNPNMQDAPGRIKSQLDELRQFTGYRPVVELHQSQRFRLDHVDKEYWDAIERAYGIVIFHTGCTHGAHIQANPATDPANWKEIIEAHPDITFVGSQCGRPGNVSKNIEYGAIDMAKKYPNLFLEHSELLERAPGTGGDYFRIGKPAFEKTREELYEQTSYNPAIKLADKCVGGTKYPAIPNIQKSRNSQIDYFKGFDPFKNTYKILRKNK